MAQNKKVGKNKKKCLKIEKWPKIKRSQKENDQKKVAKNKKWPKKWQKGGKNK